MIVAGVMSGTSADGINVAVVRIGEVRRSGARSLDRKSSRQRGQECPHHTLLAHEEFPFPSRVRRMILETMNAELASVADLARLNFLLGELYAETIRKTARKHRVQLDLIGCHGQTIYHQGDPAPYLGKKIVSTWQTGEGAIVAALTGVPVVSDFRPADMAAGGQGAPLVPFVDYLLYRDEFRGRVALNIGGIANVTVVPAAARPEQVFAFDTGPGNMIVDALVERFTRGRSAYDHDARMALSGRTIPELLGRLMREPYLLKKPPKSTGREHFGASFAQRIIAWGRAHHAGPADLVRTSSVFTSLSIADAFRRFIVPRVKVHELIVAGGGARNPLMMAQLAASLPGIEVVPASRFGVPVEAKEAFCFALLAYETYHGRPANLPSATGAKHPAVLGKIAIAGKGKLAQSC